MSDLSNKIYKVLRYHSVNNMVYEDADDTAVMLVDLVCADGSTIDNGENELWYLANEIAYALDPGSEAKASEDRLMKWATGKVIEND